MPTTPITTTPSPRVRSATIAALAALITSTAASAAPLLNITPSYIIVSAATSINDLRETYTPINPGDHQTLSIARGEQTTETAFDVRSDTLTFQTQQTRGALPESAAFSYGQLNFTTPGNQPLRYALRGFTALLAGSGANMVLGCTLSDRATNATLFQYFNAATNVAGLTTRSLDPSAPSPNNILTGAPMGLLQPGHAYAWKISINNNYFPATTPIASTLAGSLSLTATLPADYNHDGYVDAADYTLWADSFGQTSTPDDYLSADGNLDGIVNAADYTLWADAFGQGTPPPTTSATIPEPITLAPLALLTPITLLSRRRK